MGKMRGNRLNTAANVGSFITGRQQLSVQRSLVQQNAVQAELAAVQLAELRRQQYQKLREWADAEVAAGRLSQAEADNYVETYTFNLTTPAPQPSDRITARFSEFLVAGLNAGGPRDGWYNQGDGTARYWDGNAWTHHTTSLKVARELVQRLSAEKYKGVRREMTANTVTAEEEVVHDAEALAEKSAALPAQPPMPPTGWYPTGTPGVLGYWDGQAWTGETRPDPKSFPG